VLKDLGAGHFTMVQNCHPYFPSNYKAFFSCISRPHYSFGSSSIIIMLDSNPGERKHRIPAERAKLFTSKLPELQIQVNHQASKEPTWKVV